MSFFQRIFRCSQNKFFAVLFAGLALAITTGWMIYGIIVAKAAFFTFTNIWNYFILFLIYGTLFVYNIKNDNRAYTAILLLLFAEFIGSAIDIVYTLISLIQARFAPDSLVLLPSMILDIGVMIIAIMAFMQVNAYRIGRTDNYKKVRLFLVLFAITIVLPSVVTTIIYACMGLGIDALMVFVVSMCIDFAGLCAAVSAIFTFNRLIR